MKNIRCPECSQITSVENVSPGDEIYCNACGGILAVYPPNMELHQNGTCTYCGTEIADADISVVCPLCFTEYHEECWRDGDGCATYGCEKTGALANHILRITEQDLNPTSPAQNYTQSSAAQWEAKGDTLFDVIWNFIRKLFS